ncbi:MAG: addiction module protein [Bacteroidia bacterium]
MSELQKQILALPVAERLQLIAFIATSISGDEVGHLFTVPDEWIKEALERDEKYKQGKSATYTWDEVKTRIYGGK